MIAWIAAVLLLDYGVPCVWKALPRRPICQCGHINPNVCVELSCVCAASAQETIDAWERRS